jgi:hypothetical protein
MHDIISGKAKVAFHERSKKPSQKNRIGGVGTADEHEELAGRYLRILRMILPGMLAEFSTIGDPRDKRRITHTLPVLVFYGILIFLCQTESRRAANRDIGGSRVSVLIEEFVPGFESIPHADTLWRLLGRLDANGLEDLYADLLADFIRSGKFRDINPGPFLVAADGTQKFSRGHKWDSRALSKNADDPGKERYYAYMLESVLILPNGMVLPLLTETLENDGTLDANGKQDCESKAFKRLAARLAKLLGKGCVTIVLDGLYATGPIVSLCNSYGWEYMISLKNDCLQSVWEDFNGLRKIETDNRHEVQHGDRRQEYNWSNGIEYIYGGNNKRLVLNVVTCLETWREEYPRKNKKPRHMSTKYAWLSSLKITAGNVFSLCVRARRRWRIENHFNVEKNQNNYEHCFSYDWNAMKGFHALSKYANFIHALILHSLQMQEYIVAEGKKGVIKKAWSILRLIPISGSCTKSVVRKARMSTRCSIIHYSKFDLCLPA